MFGRIDDEKNEFLFVPDKNLEFGSLIDRAAEIQNDCADFMVTDVRNNMHFYPSDMSLTYKDDGGNLHQQNPLGNWAFGQLCNKLGVPANYVRRCIEAGDLDLAGQNVNAWLEDYEKPFMLRMFGDKCRGVLSDRYGVLDTPDILDVISNELDMSKYKMRGLFLTDERLHLRISQTQKMKINGEDLFAGIQIDSSDVGRSPLQVKFMIYKQVCTNGLCVSRGAGMLYSQRHVSINMDEFRKEFAACLRTVPALVTDYSDYIRVAKGTDFIPERPSEADIKTFVETVRAKTRLTEEAALDVMKLATEKYDRSKWGVINGITEHAQKYSLERRIELESAAAELLAA